MRKNGFTLVELMVAIGIGGFVMMLAIGTLMNMSTQNSLFNRALDTDMEQMHAVSLVNSIFAQAIDLRSYGNNDLNTYVSVSGSGMLRDYDSNTYWNSAGAATQTLALFWRDDGHSVAGAPGALTSTFKKTAIYFQRPTLTQYGVLFVNLGNSASLVPTRQDMMFEGLTRVRILNVHTYQANPLVPLAQQPVTSFDIEMTFRHFFGASETQQQRTYCPDEIAAAGTCTNVAPHKDVIMNYQVNVRDTVLSTSVNGTRGARLYDQIHFFAPLVPGGL